MSHCSIDNSCFIPGRKPGTSPDIIRAIKSREMRWAGHIECTGEIRNTYKILIGKREGKGPLGTPGHTWED
jgi:hypothetical protein